MTEERQPNTELRAEVFSAIDHALKDWAEHCKQWGVLPAETILGGDNCLQHTLTSAVLNAAASIQAEAQQEIERLESEIAEVQRQLRGLVGMFCESHLDTTLSDANINSQCPLCAAEKEGKCK